jgi:hypothetical protein
MGKGKRQEERSRTGRMSASRMRRNRRRKRTQMVQQSSQVSPVKKTKVELRSGSLQPSRTSLFLTHGHKYKQQCKCSNHLTVYCRYRGLRNNTTLGMQCPSIDTDIRVSL